VQRSHDFPLQHDLQPPAMVNPPIRRLRRLQYYSRLRPLLPHLRPKLLPLHVHAHRRKCRSDATIRSRNLPQIYLEIQTRSPRTRSPPSSSCSSSSPPLSKTTISEASNACSLPPRPYQSNYDKQSKLGSRTSTPQTSTASKPGALPKHPLSPPLSP
jgi:hypothetical protein